MSQNIYDEDAFLKGYAGLPRSVHGLDGAPEWPDVARLLPDLAGLHVVDLGCGFGWFARWAAERGAAAVLGLDISENMLARAARDNGHPALRYERADLDNLDLPAASLDLAYSSLAFHYVEDFGRLATAIHDALRPGSPLVFTIEHPVFMAANDAAWREGPDGAPLWPVDHYFHEGERRTDWFVPGVVKYHRTMATTLMSLIGAGFIVDHVQEWRPTSAQIAAHPDWARELHRPMFLIVKATRR